MELTKIWEELVNLVTVELMKTQHFFNMGSIQLIHNLQEKCYCRLKMECLMLILLKRE